MVGKNALILYQTGKKVHVYIFINKVGDTIKVDVVDGAVCYDYEYLGKIYITMIKSIFHL